MTPMSDSDREAIKKLEEIKAEVCRCIDMKGLKPCFRCDEFDEVIEQVRNAIAHRDQQVQELVEVDVNACLAAKEKSPTKTFDEGWVAALAHVQNKIQSYEAARGGKNGQ